ncbi:MAG: carbohydrate ABC transporter permease [Lachnospiraceae bacterium]|jgi:putative aldouronate transport system permease protein|nr:carbohydrate ABC transporter permease [Lachnospiraceae bacterium]
METAVHGRQERIFQLVINLILIFFAFCAIVPFIMLVSSSFTEESTLMTSGYNFWPKKFSAFSYTWMFATNGARIFRAYGVTFFITIFGTVCSLLVGPMLAWPLSRGDYPRAKFFTFIVFFTMIFNGGVVPSYIMWTQIFHIKNTIWSLIFPNLLFNGFYIILMKNNFKSNIHPALIEAAKLDGAGEWYIYFKIVMPLSLPILATIGLMVGLGYWNDWTNGLYYITDTNLYSLQIYLKSIMDNINSLSSMSSSISGVSAANMPGTSIRMAIAVIGVIPVMALYPFFQKSFVAGIALGGVKE